MIASGLGITVASARHAEIIASALRGVSAITVTDAERVPLSLVGRSDRLNPLIEGLRAVARQIGEQSEPELKNRGIAGASAPAGRTGWRCPS